MFHSWNFYPWTHLFWIISTSILHYLSIFSKQFAPCAVKNHLVIQFTKESENKSQWCWALKLSYFFQFCRVGTAPTRQEMWWKTCSVACFYPFPQPLGLGVKKKTCSIVSRFLLWSWYPFCYVMLGFNIHTCSCRENCYDWCLVERSQRSHWLWNSTQI